MSIILSSQTPSSPLLNNGSNFCTSIHHDLYPAIAPTNPANQLPPDYRVVITGCSKGLGRAVALAFAQAGAAKIALASRSGCGDVVAAMKQVNPAVDVLDRSVDVASEPDMRAFAEAVRSQWGYVDAVIANAGVLLSFQPITEFAPTEWWAHFQTNVFGTFLTAHNFLPLLLAAPATSPKLFLAASSVGAHMTAPGASAYQTTKLAICRFVEFVAREYAAQGIVAVASHPGSVVTATSRAMGEQYQSYLTDTPELGGGWAVWVAKEKRAWLGGRYVSVQWDVDEFEGKRKEIEAGDLLKVRMAVDAGGAL